MHGRNNAEPARLERIILRSLWPSSSHPIRLYGRFERGELVFCSAPDMGLEWTRAGQSAEEFERLVVNSILQARGLPPLDDVDMRGRREAAPSRGLTSVC